VLSNLASAAVLDRETGLVWEKAPSSTTGFLYQPITYCYRLTIGGRGGWRVPRVEELTSLLPLPSGSPFTNVGSVAFWSVSPYAPDFTGHAIVFPDEGIVNESNSTNPLAPDADNNWRPCCVRGGIGGNGNTTAN